MKTLIKRPICYSLRLFDLLLKLIHQSSTLQEACARGNIVVNKQSGEVIDEITADVEEILLVQVVAGG